MHYHTLGHDLVVRKSLYLVFQVFIDSADPSGDRDETKLLTMKRSQVKTLPKPDMTLRTVPGLREVKTEESDQTTQQRGKKRAVSFFTWFLPVL